MPTPRLSSLLRSESMRVRIVAGAARAFGERGVAAATIRDVLEAAGVSRRTFYDHFSNKEDVLDGLFAASTDLLLAALEAAVTSEMSLRERAVRAVDCYLTLVAEAGPLVTVLTAEAMRSDSRLARRREQALDGFVRVLLAGCSDGTHVDPLVIRTVLLATEGVILHLSRAGRFGKAERARAAGVLLPMAHRVFAEAGASPPLLPRAALAAGRKS